MPPFYRLKLSKPLINMVIDYMFDIIVEELLVGVPVQIRGYGVLDPKVIRGRRTRDYKTGDIKDVKPFLHVTFKLARKWKRIGKKMAR